ncbi:hypothetical protein PPYR_05203 [Photinus pyralis]|uniref:Peptidase S1 domain-containing protein n=1 Tax=Photinus pyralis TaxID=7054 RepID=A0A1Y1KUF1_PHOPY|nr:trypsin I-P1-like [Photinus pyralis]KAB0803017.1 hypothetical protein PPYR_05203 [Photinus pyralis]
MQFFKCVTCFLFLSATIKTGVSRRIIGGRPAKDKEVPYQVGLRTKYYNSHFCGGSLISPLHVLTAAHCLCITMLGKNHPRPETSFYIIAGQTELQVNESSIIRDVGQLIFHAGYNAKTVANDIGLVKMTSEIPLSLGGYVNRIPFADTSVTSGVCVVSGWGVTQYGMKITSEQLLLVEVQIINTTICRIMYEKVDVSLVPGMMCAGIFEGGKDACQGDSGGPLACGGKLVGIISTGEECGDGRYPGIYSDIQYFRQWIKDSMRDMDIVSDSSSTTPDTTISNSTPSSKISTTQLFTPTSTLAAVTTVFRRPSGRTETLTEIFPSTLSGKTENRNNSNSNGSSIRTVPTIKSYLIIIINIVITHLVQSLVK